MLAHARKIVVDGVEYTWIFSGGRVRDEGSSFCGHVVVQQGGAGRRLVVWLKARGFMREPMTDWGETPFRGAVTPADVEKIIREGLKLGWDPTSKGKQFNLKTPLDIKDYEVQEASHNPGRMGQQPNPPLKCFDCDSDKKMTRSWKTQRFEYGSMTLEATVPVWTCPACGATVTKGDAEVIRDQAVKDYKAGKRKPVARVTP